MCVYSISRERYILRIIEYMMILVKKYFCMSVSLDRDYYKLYIKIKEYQLYIYMHTNIYVGPFLLFEK